MEWATRVIAGPPQDRLVDRATRYPLFRVQYQLHERLGQATIGQRLDQHPKHFNGFEIRQNEAIDADFFQQLLNAAYMIGIIVRQEKQVNTLFLAECHPKLQDTLSQG